MKKTIALAIAASTLALGSAAAAQDRPERGADMTRNQVETNAQTRFDRMDANDDGVLNEADREARARAMFASQDGNGDGLLSFEEMQAHRAERHEMRTERRAEAGERQGRRGHRMARRGHRGGDGMRAMLRERVDADSDGAISRAEFAAAATARFDRLDADSNGTVTADERRSQRSQRSERMQQRRERRSAQ